MIRALIVDDEPLPRERIRMLLDAHEDVVVIGECGDGKEALLAIQDHAPDLVFLDIQMPELDGFGVLRALPEAERPIIIFITAYDEYAIDAFETGALDYVLKPIHAERFEKALARAVAHRDHAQKQEVDRQLSVLLQHLKAERGYTRRFAVRHGATLYFIRTEDIEWIEAAANYAQLHVGGKVHLVRETMKALEAQLNPEVFVRVHRSLIVNIDCVTSIQPYTHGEYSITMQDGTRLTTSRTYSNRLRTFFG